MELKQNLLVFFVSFCFFFGHWKPVLNNVVGVLVFHGATVKVRPYPIGSHSHSFKGLKQVNLCFILLEAILAIQ